MNERIAKSIDMDTALLKAEILRLTSEYSRRVHCGNRPGDDPLRTPFDATRDTVPYAGRVFDEQEVVAAVDSTLDFWLTLGPQGHAFEQELASFLGVRNSLLVNSGSSANLIAFATLTSYKLPKERRINPGDEVITVAAGFPTTVAPIIQCRAVPVFIDANPVTANADSSQLEDAYRPGKTKAVMMAHALGNPFDLRTVLQFCQKYNLWLIEDNCDSLGSTYSMPIEDAEKLELNHLLAQAKRNATVGSEDICYPKIIDGRLVAYTGSFGDLSTQSFYPPHHLTTGEGGAVNIIRQAALKPIAESFRDWGRDCWCPSGKDNTCNKRFGWQLGELPEGYDHKYIYTHLGYNLKPLEPQAAIGRAQLKKLPGFITTREKNWRLLREKLGKYGEFLGFSLPTHATAWSSTGFAWDDSGCQTSCSWFGFMLRVSASSKFSHSNLAEHLDESGVGNRMLFGGNLLRQPALVSLRDAEPPQYRAPFSYPGADSLMSTAIFLGTYPGLTEAMLDHEVQVISQYIHDKLRIN